MNFTSKLNYNEIDIYLGLSFYIIINLLIVMLNIKLIKNKKNRLIIFGGIFIRSLIIFSDNFIKLISFSGNDGIEFHYATISKINNLQTVFTNFPFVKTFIFPIYKITGIEIPITIQTINLLLFWIICFLLCKFMKDCKNSYKSLLLLNFSLVSSLLSVSVLREMLIVFLVTCSIICFYKWTKNKNINYLFIFILGIILSAYQHTGMIFLLVCPLIYIILELKKWEKIIGIIVMTILIVIITPKLMSIGYLARGLELEKTIINQSKSIRMSSSYIGEINSTKDIYISFPLRYIYFLFSPLPHQIRGITDFLTFIFNSLIYILINLKILKYVVEKKSRYNTKTKKAIDALIYSYIISNLVYALGTTTSGTAIRHRDKFLTMLLIIMYLIEIKIRDREKNEKYFNYKKRKSIFTRS